MFINLVRNWTFCFLIVKLYGDLFHKLLLEELDFKETLITTIDEGVLFGVNKSLLSLNFEKSNLNGFPTLGLQVTKKFILFKDVTYVVLERNNSKCHRSQSLFFSKFGVRGQTMVYSLSNIFYLWVGFRWQLMAALRNH